MQGFEQERRGLFDGLQVPFAPSAVVLAAAGLLVYWVGIVVIEGSHSGIPGETHCRLLGGMLGNVSSRMGWLGGMLAHWGGWQNTATHYDPSVWVLFIAWTTATWAFFSAAINRIAAMRLAREETPELREVIRFAVRKFLPNVLSVLFVLLLVGFFYVICNATIAGWLGSIPVVGDIILGTLFFLVLASSFLVVFVATLGALGFNLASAAIATESSDTFDGVSRAWNYILARPWTVVLTYLGIFAYVAVVLFAGHWILKVSVRSLSLGPWGLGHGEEVVEVDQNVRETLRLADTTRLEFVVIPAKGEYLYQRIVHGELRPSGEKGAIYYTQSLVYELERYRVHMGHYPRTLQDLKVKPQHRAETWLGPYLKDRSLPVDRWGRELNYALTPDGYLVTSMGPDGRAGTLDDLSLSEVEAQDGRLGPQVNVAPLLDGGTRSYLTGAVSFWVNVVLRLLLYGYVVAYVFSAQTTVYFLLRKDVEGDDYTEIVLDEDAESFLADVGPPMKPTEGGGSNLPLAGGPSA
jgi:hypothetical protein